VDYLFNSLPSLEEPNLLGIILTGMGKDGARGLLKLRESGAFTIAQDEESSIVFGMPKEAIALGAAMKIISLDEMANNIVLEFNKFIKNSAA
jgi:two-component system chemotaxis response regulator CheB